jgi:predicted amidohydrolase
MHTFKIAAGQIASVRGDMDRNIATHAMAMAAAATYHVSVLVFPELSLTGYEPDLAADLAISAADERLAPLIALARQHQIAAVVGPPLHNGPAKPSLGAIVRTASGGTGTYHKMHLGRSEPTYVTPVETPCVFAVAAHTIGIAICADSA